jgi:GNAT superfamily N-acetyltransferase
MRTDADPVEAAERNFIGSFRKLVEHAPASDWHEFGGVAAFSTHVPISIFNGCIVARPAPDDDVVSALDWITGFDVPYPLWVRDDLADQVGPVAVRRGMTENAWRVPHMVLHPIPDLPLPGSNVMTALVEDRRSLDAFRGVFIEDGMPADLANRLFSDSFATDPDVRMVVARLDDRPVGTSIAIRTGGVSGVYAVGTHPDARRRGVGTAATWAAVAAGQMWGCETIVLQSSEMGFPLYEAMGFRTVVRYRTYRPPS